MRGAFRSVSWFRSAPSRHQLARVGQLKTALREGSPEGCLALRRSGGSAIHILGRLACTLVVFSGLITVSGSFRAL